MAKQRYISTALWDDEWFVEEFPRQVLFQRQREGILPWFPVWDDIKTFDGKPWRHYVDIVAGGFPCQDISSAGKGAGIEGERSRLWVEMARVVSEVRPRFVLVENSPMLSRGLETFSKTWPNSGNARTVLLSTILHANYGLIGLQNCMDSITC